MLKNILFTICILLVAVLPVQGSVQQLKTPVTIIVPSRKTDATKTIADIFIKYAKKYWDETEFIIELVPCGSGQVGFEKIAHAKPDGQTVGLVFTPQLISNILTKQAEYTLEDFFYIGNFEYDPTVVVVPINSPIKSLADILTYSKTRILTASINGYGSDDFIAIKQLEALARIKLDIIPTKSSTEQKTISMEEDTDVHFMNLSQAYAKHESKQLVIIAVLLDKRIPLLPDVPTAKEQGFPITIEATRGLAAPKAINTATKEKLKELFSQVTSDQNFLDECAREQIFLEIMSNQSYYNYLKKEKARLCILYTQNPW